MLQHLEQFYYKAPTKKAEKKYWQDLYGCATSFVISNNIDSNLLVIITPDILTTTRLERELEFFLGRKKHIPLLVFPDWETLPYDHFSPNEEIISQRLLALYQMPFIKSGIILVAATTLMHRLPAKNYVAQNSFILELNEIFDINQLYKQLECCRYTRVSKVIEHGEFAVRGSIIDVFPIGSKNPFRIDFLDTKIDSIRIFDTNTQRSSAKVSKIQLLPAKEYPLNDEAISRFRQTWRSKFIGDPLKCPLYQSIINQESHPGIEYYLPLFFEQTSSLFDYIPSNSVIVRIGDNIKIMEHFWQTINERYEQLRHDQTRPLLTPQDIFITVDQIFAEQNKFPQILINSEKYKEKTKKIQTVSYFKTKNIPDVFIDNKALIPLIKLQNILKNNLSARTLFIAESAGRREILLELLRTINVTPIIVESWQEFANGSYKLAITTAPIIQPLCLLAEDETIEILVITEKQILGERIIQYQSDNTALQNSEAIVRDLAELKIGMPIVHIDHGIGRYLGLQKLPVNDYETEFLILEYADKARLYVPVAALNLISRYAGTNTEHYQLNHLGTKQWEKIKREATIKIRDIAAELLEIYAHRANVKGFSFAKPGTDYERFVTSFQFNETPDQQRAINDVISDMMTGLPMDRLICGDVGFGKTEVAMRAAFIAIFSGKQVAILAPTTILAQQHFTNFQDRFVDWPVKIVLFSRFSSTKEQKTTIDDLASGKIDIIIGTHKLLQKTIKFKNLGLLVIDEEHRFGVKQKEHIKKLATNIDILTLTATPIPRTLSMAFANIRNFSIIATPPAKRLAIKTLVHERDSYLIKEAISREISRGGQVYFLHNDISTIEKTANELQQLTPTAHIAIAHGQMRKQQLEQIMYDFYHLQTNILVCTTIIESGIDVPTANTIIIDRADRFGLAQIHQLRGRVGRSHHQAYAYLITPPNASLTPDAKKRLEAIASMENLGAGFVLATHDLEIRGAGELLGENQSGEIQNIGFSLYMEMLGQAVLTLKSGKEIDIEKLQKSDVEIDLQIPALIPDKYIDDVNLRLILYKRISSAKDEKTLDDLQIEIIDRFGLLPEFTKNLFKLAKIKLKAQKLGIIKIVAGKTKGIIEFSNKPNINPKTIIQLIQKHHDIYKLAGSCKIEFTIKQDTIKTDFLNKLLKEFLN